MVARMVARNRRAAALCLWAALGGASLLVVAPLAYRVGVLGVLPALALTAAAMVAAALAVVVAPIAWALSRADHSAMRQAQAALVVAVAVLVMPVWTIVGSAGAPPIHQITTDHDDVPQFDAVIALRGDGSNPLDPPSPELTRTQRDAYPDIQPVETPRPPFEVFAASLRVIEELGWDIVATTGAVADGDDRVAAGDTRGREPDRLIEATESTSWFGFKDDVVVRVRQSGEGTRVDLRSVSRVGVGDLGANANRIRAFVRALESTLASGR